MMPIWPAVCIGLCIAELPMFFFLLLLLPLTFPPLLPPPFSLPPPSPPPSSLLSSFVATVFFLLQKVQDFFFSPLSFYLPLKKELFPFQRLFFICFRFGKSGGKKEISILLGSVPECSNSQGGLQELFYVRDYLSMNK